MLTKLWEATYNELRIIIEVGNAKGMCLFYMLPMHRCFPVLVSKE